MQNSSKLETLLETHEVAGKMSLSEALLEEIRWGVEGQV